MNSKSGFTLVELMITMAVVAIVLTVGVPGFQDMIRENRLRTQAHTFLTALSLTRSEAIKRGVRVTLCKSSDGQNCIDNDKGYEQGWIVFADPSNPPGATVPTVDPGDIVIRVYGTLSGGLVLTGNSTVKSYVSYAANGRSQLLSGGFQAGTLTLCAPPKARLIVINSIGRARVAEGTC